MVGFYSIERIGEVTRFVVVLGVGIGVYLVLDIELGMGFVFFVIVVFEVLVTCVVWL